MSFLRQVKLETLTLCFTRVAQTVNSKNIDLEKNIDLLAVAFNAAVVNRFNKNGDGIDSETAVAVKDYFVHKPTNIEHDRDKIVGHIVSAGFQNMVIHQSLWMMMRL